MAFGLDLGNLLVHLRADDSQFNRSLLNAEKRLSATADKFNAIGRSMTMRVTAPLVGIAVAATKSFASFDDAMTQSLAIMGDVTLGLRTEMERTARDISKESITSATDLAKSYFYLASAGLSAEQSIAALGAVEKFAVAGRFDMALATDLVTDAQSALGLTVKDAQKNLENMTRVTDVLIGANTLANASAQQFSEALMRAGPTMKSYGIELEEGVAVLAAYADQGKKAAEGGELFGRMLRLMIKGAVDNAEAWKRFNISIVDANDDMRPLADIIRDLTNLLDGMGVTQRATTLDMLGFQARSQQAILPLLGLGDAIELYLESLEGMAGITQRTAEKQLKSFSSQMKTTWQNVTDVARDIGRMLAPSVLKMSEYVVRATELWHSLNESVKQNVILYAALAAAIGPVLIVTGMLLKTLAFMVTTVKAVLGVFAGLTAAIAAPVVPILALVAVVYALRAAWVQNLEVVKKRLEWFAEICREMFDYVANTVIGKWIKWFSDWFVVSIHRVLDSAKKEFGNFAKDLGGVFRGIKALVKGEDFWQAFVEGYDQTEKDLQKIGRTVVKTFETTSLYLSAYGEATAEHFGDLMEAVKTQFGEDADAIIGLIKSKIESLKTPMDELRKAEERAFGEKTTHEEVTRALEAETQKVRDLAVANEEAADEAERNATALADAYRSVRGEMGKMTKDVYEGEMAALSELKLKYEKLGMDVKTLTSWYEEQVEVLEIEYLQAVGGLAGGFRAAGTQMRREMKSWGEVAYEFSMELETSIARGLENTLRNFDNWKEQLLRMLEEIYWAALRIAFIEPAAKGLAGAFAGAAGSLLGGGGGGGYPAQGVRYGLQHGGTVAKTGWAVVHEGETFSGVNHDYGERPIEVNVNYIGQEKHEVSVEESVGEFKQTVLKITMEAMQNEPKYRRGIRQAARS